MKALLKTLELLKEIAPESLINLNKKNSSEAYSDPEVEQQIVAAIHENLDKIKDEWLTVDTVMTVSEFEYAVKLTMLTIPLFILPTELLAKYEPALMKLNYITLDGQAPTDEILATEGQKAGVFNFSYGSVTDQNILLGLTFKFN